MNPLETHLFSSYISGASDDLLAGITHELDGLKGQPSSDTQPCFVAPPLTVSDRVQGVAFAVADPAAGVVRDRVVTTYQGTAAVIGAAVAGVKFGLSAVHSTIATIGGFLSSPKVNPNAPENYEKNFQVVKSLYGSSLNKQDYDDLNGSQGGAVATALLPHDMTLEEMESKTPAALETPPAVVSVPTVTPAIPATTTAPVVIVHATTTPPAATTTPPQASSTQPVRPVIVMPGPGGTSLPPPPTLFDGSTVPPTLTVAECASSLNPNFCLIDTATANLSWTSVTNATNYIVRVDGTQVTSTAGTSATISLTDQATSTIDVVAVDNANNTSTSTAQDVTVDLPFVPQHGTLTENFDAFPQLSWNTFGSNAKLYDFVAATTSGPCFSGGCVAGNGNAIQIPRMYAAQSTGLLRGAFTFYTKASPGFNNPDPVISVCITGTGCADASSITRISFSGVVPIDDTWHQYFIAWRQGSSEVQSCILQDDTDATHCSWRTGSGIPNGTTFDSIAFWSGNGYRSDNSPFANIWIDELVQE
jgi:hypothetical protein